MNRAAIPAVLAAVLGTAGISYFAFAHRASARIDGSSAEAYRASLDAIGQSLAPEATAAFEAALAAHARAELPRPGPAARAMARLAALSAETPAPSPQLLRRIDGMTAEQVIRTAPAEVPTLTDLVDDRIAANESAAIATLKNVSSAQAQCQASGVIDLDHNGVGEYGFFAELAGAEPLRGENTILRPPVLSSAFGNIDAYGNATRSGYHFRIYLPDAKAQGVCRAPGDAVDPRRSEVLWCCYAWPTDAGRTGRRAFFVNQAGDLFACTNSEGRYSGPAQGPAMLAAFDPAGSDMGGIGAIGKAGHDGQSWTVIR